MQHHLHFVQFDIQLGVEGFGHFLEGFFEVAVVVDAVDQGRCDQAILVRHGRQVQLPEQVAVQTFAVGGASGEVPFVIIVAGQAAGAGLVDVFPGRIDWQLVGDALAPLAFFQVVHRGGGFLVAVFLVRVRSGAFGAIGHWIAVVEVVAVFLALEHGIGLQRLLDFLLQVQGRQLEEADSLLQLRGHRQLLAHLED